MELRSADLEGRDDSSQKCENSEHVTQQSFQRDAVVVERETDSCISADISACVDVAFSMLPFSPPKPIWEQGVWADIFGNGAFMQNSWTAVGPVRMPFANFRPTQVESPEDSNPRAKARKVAVDGSCYSAVVVHRTDQSWQEERESMMQNALKRWLVVCSCFNAKTTIRTQLDCSVDEMSKLSLLADVFRGRAPATLLKRVRAVEKLCHYFGIGKFPPSEPMLYEFFVSERDRGAPPSRLKGFMEGLNFCLHIMSMDELSTVVCSRRCMGATTSDVPKAVNQAEPLRVEDLKTLHTVLLKGESWNRVFAGAILFATYARARWADLMHTDKLVVDRDDCQEIAFLEGHTSTHKTMRSSTFKHRFLPLTAHGQGVTSENWAEAWLDARACVGAELPPKHVVMPAPDEEGRPSMRPLTSGEASQWLRKVLTGCKDVDPERKVSIHSCKATCLSFCAKYGLDAMTRLQLGYHTGGDAGLRMVHTYSRDALAEPLGKLGQVLKDIRDQKFKPDCTRSGRFVKFDDTTVPAADKPMPQGREVEIAEDRRLELVDLVSEKSEDVSDADVCASSSSDESSEEEFQEEQQRTRFFLPPTAPDGFVFWQHSKLKTLHLTRPEYSKYFMCNRPIGPFHVKENMSIRYDTPVCRQCASATKA